MPVVQLQPGAQGSRQKASVRRTNNSAKNFAVSGSDFGFGIGSKMSERTLGDVDKIVEHAKVRLS